MRAKQLSAVAIDQDTASLIVSLSWLRGCLTYERKASPPWRDLAIDYPRSRLGNEMEIFHINARDIHAAFGAISNEPIVCIIRFPCDRR